MVVPGTVISASKVVPPKVLPDSTLVVRASRLIVLGEIVVPGNVVVYVNGCPNSVIGIALPTPELVNWDGRVRVDVFGFDGEEGDP